MQITLVVLHHALNQELDKVSILKCNHADDVPGVLLVFLALATYWEDVFRE